MTAAALAEIPQALLSEPNDTLHFMRKLSCVVVESDERERALLRRAIGSDRELVLLGEASNASEGFALLREHRPALLLLGVELPDGSGFEIVEALHRAVDRVPEVIFISSCERHALKALEASAAGYLLRPLDLKKLRTVLALAKERASKRLDARGGVNDLLTAMRSSRIAVKSHGRIVFLRPDSIDWVESKRNYICLHVGKEVHRIRESIQSFELKLRAQPFVRIHRSTIVNINRIREVQRWYTGEYIVRLDTGKELTLSKTYRDQFFAITSARAS